MKGFFERDLMRKSERENVVQDNEGSISHCLCQVSDVSRLLTHRVMPSLSDAGQSLNKTTDERREHSLASNSPQVRIQAAHIYSEAPGRNHLVSLAKIARKKMETLQIQRIRNSSGKQRGK